MRSPDGIRSIFNFITQFKKRAIKAWATTCFFQNRSNLHSFQNHYNFLYLKLQFSAPWGQIIHTCNLNGTRVSFRKNRFC